MAARRVKARKTFRFMSDHTYEVEIKSLLGSRESADALKEKMRLKDPNLELLERTKQLNHYFMGGDPGRLYVNTAPLISKEERKRFNKIIEDAEDFSVRTRSTGGVLSLVVKASIDEGTSANSTARLELDAKIAGLSMDALDKIVLDSGFEYQAKWSREREEYRFLGVGVTVDKNAGYGYVAEFEIIEGAADKVEEAKARLRKIMSSVGVEELSQERLERMFSFYNDNWQDYYGTDKVFVVE